MLFLHLAPYTDPTDICAIDQTKSKGEQRRKVHSQCLWPGGISVYTVCRYGQQSLRGPPPRWVCGSCHNASPRETECTCAGQTTLMQTAKEPSVFIHVGTAPPTPVRLLPFYIIQAPTPCKYLSSPTNYFSCYMDLYWLSIRHHLNWNPAVLGLHSSTASSLHFPVFSMPSLSCLPAVLRNKCRSRWPRSTPSATALQLGTFSHHRSTWSHLRRDTQSSVAWPMLGFKHSQSSLVIRTGASGQYSLPVWPEAHWLGRGTSVIFIALQTLQTRTWK